MVGIPTVLTLMAASAVVGLRWNWRVWLLAAAAFYIPYAVLFTSFGTNPGGFGSGIWESLGYWVGQDGPRRGGPHSTSRGGVRHARSFWCSGLPPRSLATPGGARRCPG